MSNLVEHVKNSIDKANNHVSDIDDRILALDGMSSPKVRHLLNNLAKVDLCNYLEIGCWKGSTCISALYKNKVNKHWVIDNFSLFGGPKQDFLNNFNTIIGSQPNLIDRDYISFNPVDEGISDVNVYFYDGEHVGQHQATALSHYVNSVQKEFIYVCDDWEWWDVKNVTMKAISDLKLEPLYQAVLPANTATDTDRWWNGIYVGVLRKP